MRKESDKALYYMLLEAAVKIIQISRNKILLNWEGIPPHFTKFYSEKTGVNFHLKTKLTLNILVQFSLHWIAKALRFLFSTE